MVITNESEEPLFFKNETGKNADDYPEYCDALEKELDGVYFFFKYGEEKESLTTVGNSIELRADVITDGREIWLRKRIV